MARKDHWWKALGYVLLCIYWFHPLLWAAYALFCRDLELACDEKVIRNMDLQEKKAYSHALLSCSSKKRIMIICPLAFSEGKLKNRIKAVLHYKKPPFWIAAAAGIACAVTALCFLTDPVKAPASAESAPGDHISAFFHENEPIPADSEQPETPSPNTESSPDMSDPSEPADNIEDAITRAILTYHAFDQSVPYDLACCDFAVLETVHSALSKEASNPTVIFYGWALYQEYQILEDGIKETGGSHLPVELTFEQTDNGWELKEYWQPRDGSYFIEDIRSRFPAHIASDGIDSQKYILPQKQNCYRQAIENSSLEPAPVIRNLLKGMSYRPLDMWVHLEEVLDDPHALVIANPPTYFSGYEKFYDTQGKMTWKEPEYQLFDPETGHQQFYDLCMGAKALVLCYQEKKVGEAVGYTIFGRPGTRADLNAYITTNREEEATALANG